MPRSKKRINLHPDDELYNDLKTLSEKKNKSLVDISLDLIKKAILLEEDLYFLTIDKERVTKKDKRISRTRVLK